MPQDRAQQEVEISSGRIQRLPQHVVERIAAGEVIERPASVARELIENALDAGATTVRVAMREGGLRLLRVADDGAGILSQDLAMACQPHATSKVRSLEDLERVATLGFRGEALASLAAVAEVEIVSAADDDGLARAITVAGGSSSPTSLASRPRGTTVTVRHLFGEVPARKALLRRHGAEGARVAAVVRHYALIHPAVRFALVADEVLTLQTRGAGQVEAVADLYGPDVARSLVQFGPQHSGAATLAGLVSPPPFDLPDRQHVVVAVNGRPVANRALMSAVEAGYRPLLRKGRHPIVVVTIAVPPEDLDANIHPAKAEVLLRDEPAIRPALRSALYAALGSAKAAARAQHAHERTALAPAVQLRLPVPRKRRGLTLGETPARYRAPAPDAEPDLSDALPELEPLGQLDYALIAARAPGGHLYLIDQHRAHERMLYDALTRQMPAAAASAQDVLTDSADHDGAMSGQMLLMPVLVELTPRQADLLLPRLEELAGIGFECQHFGGSAFLVRSLPALPEAPADPGAVARALAQDAAEDASDWLDHVRTSLACRSAIRRGQPLSMQEQRALLDGLRTTAAPARCPHGSPLILRYSSSFLARAFEW